jgi:ferric-dicitrate binding protein FerR (iron transport regulator)
VNRYSSLAVVIDDPVLAEKSFVGTFKIGDARGFVQAAAAAFDARVRERDQTLHLGR